MKKSQVIALFLGLIQAEILERHHHHNSHSLAESEILAEEVEESQEELYKMNKKYNKLQQKYDNLQQILSQKKFAEGLGENESIGESVRIKGDGKLQTFKYAQADAEDEFAEGYKENEELGEKLRMKGDGQLQTFKYAQADAEDEFAEGYKENEELGEKLRMKGDGQLQTFKYAQADVEDEFAEGLGENEGLGETIKINGNGKQEKYSYAQQAKKFAEGLGENEGLGETIRINGNGKQEKFSYAQAEDEWVSENDDLLMIEAFGKKVAFKLAGPQGPALPKKYRQKRRNHYPIKRAQDLVDQLDLATKHAQTRPPYTSTIQLDSENPGAPFGKADPKGPSLPNPSHQRKRRNHYPIKRAQDLVDQLDGATRHAQTRIPYQSTLLQVDEESVNPGAPFGKADPKGPSLPNPSHQRKRRNHYPIQRAQDLVDQLDAATKHAQTRIPYQSTLLQLDSEQPVYTNLVHIVNEDDDELVKIENTNDVPLSFEFTQMSDNNPANMEGFIMEDVHIPLNLRFVHLATEEGDVMIRK